MQPAKRRLAVVNSILVLGLVLGTQASLAAGLCSDLFRTLRAPHALAPVKPLTERPQIKPTLKLDRQSQIEREFILQSGEIDTTKLRSEFKHYVPRQKIESLINDLEKRFPPKYSLQGKLLSGIDSRDGAPRVSLTEIAALPTFREVAFGKTNLERILDAGLRAALTEPSVFKQHQQQIRLKLSKEILGPIKTDNALKELTLLHEEAVRKAKQKSTVVYTDTASTAKFSYSNHLSKAAVLESVSTTGFEFSADEIAKLGKVDYANLTSPQIEQLVGSLKKLGLKTPIARALVLNLIDRASDEGVIRFRKYREGLRHADFSGVKSPSFGHSEEATELRDADFSNGITWVEFKMKNTNGENAKKTVVNKPRLPMFDAVASEIKNPARFLDAAEFKKTKTLVKGSIRDAIQHLKDSGVKDVKLTDAEIDAALQFFRSLHQQGFSLEPIGRTVYTRQSYNFNFADSSGQSHNIQITRDSNVFELGRGQSQTLQSLPWREATRGWSFQFNAISNQYEHRENGVLRHFFEPGHEDEIYAVSGSGRERVDAQVEPVEVVELKVPLRFIEFSKADQEKVPELGTVAGIRESLIRFTHELNAERQASGLDPFAIDKGKRSVARKDISGGLSILVEQKSGAMKPYTFKFHPETGYWVHWGQNRQFVFHPSVGVQELVGGNALKFNESAELETRPVKFISPN